MDFVKKIYFENDKYIITPLIPDIEEIVPHGGNLDDPLQVAIDGHYYCMDSKGIITASGKLDGIQACKIELKE